MNKLAKKELWKRIFSMIHTFCDFFLVYYISQYIYLMYDMDKRLHYSSKEFGNENEGRSKYIKNWMLEASLYFTYLYKIARKTMRRTPSHTERNPHDNSMFSFHMNIFWARSYLSCRECI